MKRFRQLSAAACLIVVLSAAAQAAMKVELPEGAIGFHFGKFIVEDLKTIPVTQGYSDENGAGFVDVAGLQRAGGEWPDVLTGEYAGNLSGKEFTFKAKVPNGDYLVWLAAGKIIRTDLKERRYLLKLCDKSLCDETPTDEQFSSDKYLYRFMWTQYSQKPHAIWENYINVMYPATTHTVKVTDGTLTITAANHFLSAVILMPADKKEAFEKLTASIREDRIARFEADVAKQIQASAKKGEQVTSAPAPARKSGEGDVILYSPKDPETLAPWYDATDEDRKRTKVESAGGPGQNVLIVLGATSFADLGKCTLAMSDLKGPGMIPATAIQGHYKNYRSNGNTGKDGKGIPEMALLPTLTLNIEKDITNSFWLWMKVPANAAPGKYTGTFSLKSEKGKAVDVPVEFEVYPFKLEEVLPQAYGFWGTGPEEPSWSKETRHKILRDRFEWMAQTGYTIIMVPSPGIKSVDKEAGTVELNFDPTLIECAKEGGLARHPEQPLVDANTMASFGRSIGTRLGALSAPGTELKHPKFKDCFQDAVKKYGALIKKYDVPFVFNSVDEPREANLNSWNRNLADTILYCDYLKECGVRTACNPMADDSRGKDYTPLIDHVDLLSTHAWDRSKLQMRQTIEKGKTLWLYNCGRDRYSWGFYNWRAKSHGRQEWQFAEGGGGGVGGYPGQEPYNPFTGDGGLNPAAPATFKGGILHQSNMYLMADGITDYAYVYTLEQALKAAKGPKADEAKAFLAALERAMPEFPQIKGLASEADGPKVGMGVSDEARLHCDDWRKTIAGYLKELKK